MSQQSTIISTKEITFAFLKLMSERLDEERHMAELLHKPIIPRPQFIEGYELDPRCQTIASVQLSVTSLDNMYLDSFIEDLLRPSTTALVTDIVKDCSGRQLIFKPIPIDASFASPNLYDIAPYKRQITFWDYDLGISARLTEAPWSMYDSRILRFEVLYGTGDPQ